MATNMPSVSETRLGSMNSKPPTVTPKVPSLGVFRVQETCPVQGQVLWPQTRSIVRWASLADAPAAGAGATGRSQVAGGASAVKGAR
jgi:hypothetical protein